MQWPSFGLVEESLLIVLCLPGRRFSLRDMGVVRCDLCRGDADDDDTPRTSLHL